MCSILIFQSWFDNYKGKRNHCFTYDSLRSVTTIHKWLFFGLLRLSGCFDQPKGLHCWDIKRTSLPDESIKIGLQKPAQRSVHKCVQKLACKSSEIGAQATKCEEWTSVRFQKATFLRTLLSSEKFLSTVKRVHFSWCFSDDHFCCLWIV